MRVILMLALVACGSRTPEKNPDCAVIEKAPATAAATLSEKYPGDPVKVSETIERCIAPTGETCERMAKIWAAIPSMMPGGGSGMPAPMPTDKAIELCKGMPAEMQRCMLPSYVNGHPAECKKMLDDMAITSIEVAPSGPGSATPPAPACDEVAIELDKDEIRYARGAEAGKVAKVDLAGLEAGLKKLAAVCVGSAALKADPATRYQDMITVMDIAMKAGFMNIGIDSGEPADVLPHPGVADRNALKDAPVIVITKSGVMVDGKSVAAVDQDVTDPVRAALAARAMGPDDKKGLAILQADESTPARTINQAIVGAKAAGYDSLLFAVKNQ
jgi:biopolymer transport protein ExbD